MSIAVIKHLDSPIRVLTFSAKDILVYSTPVLAWGLFDLPTAAVAVAYLLLVLFRKLTKKAPKFAAVRFAYWNLPTKMFNRSLKASFPESNKRHWIW